MAKLPIKYLGIPLGVKHKDGSIWDPVISLFENRLAGWKRSLLSKGGRLTLIRSTLSNLPMYYLSILTVPAKVAKRLESIQCWFLWGDGESKRKYHLVQWRNVKLTFEEGGLGVRSIVEMNMALISKWLWRFWYEEGFLWRRVVEARWGVRREVGSRSKMRRPYGVGLWKSIGMRSLAMQEWVS